jgi:hypothetical protein
MTSERVFVWQEGLRGLFPAVYDRSFLDGKIAKTGLRIVIKVELSAADQNLPLLELAHRFKNAGKIDPTRIDPLYIKAE